MGLETAYFQLMIKWSNQLGDLYDIYRGGLNAEPLDTAYKIGSTKVLFDASLSLAFNAPNKYANATFGAVLNPRAVQPGDYLVGPRGTWFVGSTEPLKPILTVNCNAVGNFSRPGAPPPQNSVTRFTPDGTRMASYGGFYSGDAQEREEPLLSNFPMSCLNGTKGERGREALPGDTRLPWVTILVPAAPGVILAQGDRCRDNLGRQYTLSSTELTDLGWRCTAALADV